MKLVTTTVTCDRCKSEIPNNDGTSLGMNLSIFGSRAREAADGSMSPRMTFDICDACVPELGQWLGLNAIGVPE